METLWAPWRMVYVENAWPSGCLFCETSDTQQDEKNLILYRGKYVFIQMNLYPYNPGHIMIAPYRHIDDLSKLTAEEQIDLIQAAARSTSLLREQMKADGFNMGMNLGKAAGAGFAHHLHLHIVPRWNGDTNFMPIVADTKVIPEGLAATYQKLASAFSRASS